MSQFLIIPEEEKFPAYKTLSVTLAANEIYTINQTFDAFAVLEASGTMKMSLNEQEESDFDAGIQMRSPRDKAFSTCRIRETAGGAANFRILTSFGDVRDSRFTASGNLNVQNAGAPNDELQVETKAGTTLATALAGADPGLVALAASIKGTNTITQLIAALREDTLLRSPITTLDGATYFENNNDGSEQTLVSSGTNTSGIIIRQAYAHANTKTTECYLGIDDGSTKVILGTSGTGSATGNWLNSIRDIFVPSGVALVCFASGSDKIVRGWYEVL